MKKRWLSILLLGGALAVLFWLVFQAHHAFVVSLNPFFDFLFIGFVAIVVLPVVVWGVARLGWPVWQLFAVGAVCWTWWAIGWTLLLGHSTLDIHLHDTYYVIAGGHYSLALPLVMLFFTVVYYLLERKGYGNRALGRLHFWVTFIGLWYIFWPGSYEGLAGMPRRYLDVGYFNGFNRFVHVDQVMVKVAVVVIVMQLVFVGVLVYYATRKFFTRVNS